MKITAQREDLLKPLQIVGSVVERRQQSPVLANALVSVVANHLTLTGTDLEVEMISHAQVQADEDFDITLPARKLVDLCKSLPEGASVSLELDDDRAVIRSGRSRFTLSTLPAAEFPNIEPVEQALSLSLSQAQLKQLFDQTQFAMAQQDVRYYLNGLMFEVTAEALTCVATDGHRLAHCTLELDTGSRETRQVIIPRKGVIELSRLLEMNDEKLEIQLSENHIRVILPDVTFTSKLIDGKFPDYQQVIPKDSDKEVVCNRADLLQAFNRISVLSNEKFRGMRLQLEPNMIRASVNNPEQEEAEEEIEVQYSADNLEVGFNIAYFMDALSVIKSDEVSIQLKDANHSCLVKGLNDPHSRYVIMPMRL